MWDKADAFLLKDKYLGPLVKKFGPCQIKPKKSKDYFELICWDIIGQQLSGKVADIIFARFKKALGGRITPTRVLEIEPQILRDCGMSWGKASFLRDLAQKTKDKELQTKKLADLPDEEVIREMVAVKGIGNWTAHMFLMFSLARPDVFPVDDLGITKGLTKLTGVKRDKKQMVKFAQRWAPWRTVASWYIWRCLDN